MRREQTEQLVIISITTVLLVVFIGMFIVDYYKTKQLPIALEKGYEQCPKYGSGHMGELILVKSCKEYTESIKDK